MADTYPETRDLSLPADTKRNLEGRIRRTLSLCTLIAIAAMVGLWYVRDRIPPLAADWALSFGQPSDALPGPDSPLHAAFWVDKLLFQGPIPYAIIGLTLGAILYAVLLPLMGVLPSFRAPRSAPIARALDAVGPAGAPDLAAVLTEAYPNKRPNRWFRTRFALLDRVLAGGASQSDLQGANDRQTAYVEATTAHALRPIVYAEWCLPILGFIGTVWGVTAAVEGLRLAVDALYKQRELTQDVVDRFGEGFEGLILAFDTTLFGLVGLLIVGTMAYFLRKAADETMLVVDKWSGQAITAVAGRDRLEMLMRGLFETDDVGELALDQDGLTPKLRSLEWWDKILKTLAATDDDGDIVLDAAGQPLPAWRADMEQLLKGLMDTDAKRVVVTDDYGVPEARVDADLKLLRQALFLTDAAGNLVADPNTGQPIVRAEVWRQNLARWIIRELYEVTEDEAEEIARGTVEGSDREVPLRSKLERRNQQMLMRLNTIIYQMHQMLEEGPGGDGDGKAPGESRVKRRRLLDAGTGPVSSVSYDGHRSAIVRPAPVGHLGDELIVLSRVSLVPGTAGQPVPLIQETPMVHIGGVATWDDRYAYYVKDTREVISTPLDPQSCGEESLFVVPEGEMLASDPFVLAPYGANLMLAAIRYSDNHTVLSGAPFVDLFGDIAEFKTFEFSPMAAAFDPAWGLVLATEREKDGSRIHIARTLDGPFQTTPTPVDITCIAIGPAQNADDRVIWASGTMGEVLHVVPGKQAEITSLGRVDGPILGLAATPLGEVVVLAENGAAVLVMSPRGRDRAKRIQLDVPATALSGVASGRGVVLGFADGSAELWTIDGRLADRDGGG